MPADGSPKILLIDLKRIGDILLTTPSAAYLRQVFPQARIDFLVYPEMAAIVDKNPAIDRVLLFPKNKPWQLPSLLRQGRYDWAFDFIATGASAWACFFSGAKKRFAYANDYPSLVHNVKIPRLTKTFYCALEKLNLTRKALETLGLEAPEPAAPVLPYLAIDPERQSFWKNELAKSAGLGRPLVMMSPQSRRLTRQWRLDGYAQVARELSQKHGANVVCLWGPAEREIAQAVVSLAGDSNVFLAPKLGSLKDLAAFLSHARCLITNCNGPRHVAVALGVPTVTIHMSSDPVAWNPPGPGGAGFHLRHPVVCAETLFCRPCRKSTCPYNLECSSQVESAQVLEKTLGFLKP